MAGNNANEFYPLNADNKIEDFLMGKSIGEGNFGKVIVGTHAITGEQVLKIFYLFRSPLKF